MPALQAIYVQQVGWNRVEMVGGAVAGDGGGVGTPPPSCGWLDRSLWHPITVKGSLKITDCSTRWALKHYSTAGSLKTGQSGDGISRPCAHAQTQSPTPRRVDSLATEPGGTFLIMADRFTSHRWHHMIMVPWGCRRPKTQRYPATAPGEGPGASLSERVRAAAPGFLLQESRSFPEKPSRVLLGG